MNETTMIAIGSALVYELQLGDALAVSAADVVEMGIYLRTRQGRGHSLRVSVDDDYRFPACLALSLVDVGWQDRVRIEKAELDDKIQKLAAFLDDPFAIEGLSGTEQERLLMQRAHMLDYSDILGERITNFTSTPPPAADAPDAGTAASGA